MDKTQKVSPQKVNSTFASWLLKIISFPFTLYELFFTREIRNSLPGKVVLITGKPLLLSV